MDFLIENIILTIRSHILLILFTSLLAYIYLKAIKRDARVAKYFAKIPGPVDYPIVGSSLQFVLPSEELVTQGLGILNELGGVWKIWFGNIPCVILAEAQYVEKLLSSNSQIDKSFDYDILTSWLGTGLLTSNGQKWFGRRKLLTPSFHFKILEDFQDVFNEQSDTLVKILQSKHSDQKTFNIFPYIARCTLDIICETAMGRKINSQKDPNSPYLRAVNGMCDVLIKRILRPWLRPEFLWQYFPEGFFFKYFSYLPYIKSYCMLKGREEKKHLKILHGFTEKIIREKMTERLGNLDSKSEICDDTNQKKRLAFLDLLLDASDNGRVLNFRDIREETDTFMFEGHDTTSAALNWAIYLLATYPECQNKLHKELEETFGSAKNPQIKMEDLSKLKYLELCIKESLRLYPSVPFFTRGLNQDIDLGNGIILPKGCSATVFTYALHRDPKFFPDPEEFKPDRFTQENSKDRNPYAYVPFSAGPRNCIGQKFALQEEKIVLAKLFLNFRFETTMSRDKVYPCPDIILRPKDGIHVRIIKRS